MRVVASSFTVKLCLNAARYAFHIIQFSRRSIDAKRAERVGGVAICNTSRAAITTSQSNRLLLQRNYHHLGLEEHEPRSY